MNWDERIVYANAAYIENYFNKIGGCCENLQPPSDIPRCFCVQSISHNGLQSGKENSDMKNKATESDNNKSKNCYAIVNDITSIETINDRVVIVHFIDGSFTKADCGKDNPFDFDMLFTIAILKRLLDKKKGSNLYHKLIRYGHKILKAQERKAEEEKQIRDISEHRKMKKIKKKANREARAIEIYKKTLTEAIIDANRMASTSRECLVQATEDDLK